MADRGNFDMDYSFQDDEDDMEPLFNDDADLRAIERDLDLVEQATMQVEPSSTSSSNLEFEQNYNPPVRQGRQRQRRGGLPVPWDDYVAAHGGDMTQPRVQGLRHSTRGSFGQEENQNPFGNQYTPHRRELNQPRREGLRPSPLPSFRVRENQNIFQSQHSAVTTPAPVESQLSQEGKDDFDLEDDGFGHVLQGNRDPREEIDDGPRRLDESLEEWVARIKREHQRLGFQAKRYTPTTQEANATARPLPSGSYRPDERTRMRNRMETEHSRWITRRSSLHNPTYTQQWREDKRRRQLNNAEANRRLVRRIREWQARNGLPEEPATESEEDSGDGLFDQTFDFVGATAIPCLFCQRNKFPCDASAKRPHPCSNCAQRKAPCQIAARPIKVRGISGVANPSTSPVAVFQPAQARGPGPIRSHQTRRAALEGARRSARQVTPQENPRQTRRGGHGNQVSHPYKNAQRSRRASAPSQPPPQANPQEETNRQPLWGYGPLVSSPVNAQWPSSANVEAQVQPQANPENEPNGDRPTGYSPPNFRDKPVGFLFPRCFNCEEKNRICDLMRPCWSCLAAGETLMCVGGEMDPNGYYNRNILPRVLYEREYESPFGPGFDDLANQQAPPQPTSFFEDEFEAIYGAREHPDPGFLADLVEFEQQHQDGLQAGNLDDFVEELEQELAEYDQLYPVQAHMQGYSQAQVQAQVQEQGQEQAEDNDPHGIYHA